MIRETCACYTPKEGNCIYQAKCPFLHSMYYRDKEVRFESKRCDYFESHVLPADKELYSLYFNESLKISDILKKGLSLNRYSLCHSCFFTGHKLSGRFGSFTDI
ncbi:hypothetical protein [Bacillus gaemokensis]|uniref:hypothetical protein n=1 Tax=Bacillus gaemokensis TaxID=574375 RepID=UPI0013736124